MRTRGLALALALASLVGTASLSACSSISGQLDGSDLGASQPDGSLSTPTLDTVEWAVHNGIASVLVRNSTDRTLRRADAVLTVVDAQGTTLASSAAMGARGPCCTAVDLPPGESYGFYFEVDGHDDQVSDLTIGYTNVAWSSASNGTGPNAVGVPVQLNSTNDGQSIVADMTTTGGPIPRAIVQAVLRDADGDFLAVVSGRWECLLPGPPQRINLQFFHKVPPGTTVSEVSAFPLEPSADTGGEVSDAPEPDCG